MRILQFHTDSHPYLLGKARWYIRNALIQTGFNVDVVRPVEIAVGEVLTNTYRHGYDAGVGPVPSPRTQYGGRGLYMVGRLVDDVAISVNPRGAWAHSTNDGASR